MPHREGIQLPGKGLSLDLRTDYSEAEIVRGHRETNEFLSK